jgi:hypothetical protein
MEDRDLQDSVVILLNFNGKDGFCISCVQFALPFWFVLNLGILVRLGLLFCMPMPPVLVLGLCSRSLHRAPARFRFALDFPISRVKALGLISSRRLG